MHRPTHAPHIEHMSARTARSLAAMVACLCLAARAQARQSPATPLAWGTLQPGDYPVGFTAFTSIDSAGGPGRAGRPVQISVWYPARATATAARMTYGDYTDLSATERGDEATGEALSRARAQFTAFLSSNGVPTAPVERWLASAMLATRDAARRTPTGPLVLIAQGNGQTAYSQAVLAEYLASRGFVVVSTPSPLRTGSRLGSDDDVYPVAMLQSDDLRFAMRETVRRGLHSGSAVTVIGHSFGARAGLLVLASGAASELISLDGGIANRAGNTWLAGSPLRPSDISGSIVHLFQEGDSTVQPDFSLMHRMTRASRVLVRADEMRHWQFTSFGTIASSFPDVSPGAATAVGARAAVETVEFVACLLRSRPGTQARVRRCLAGRPQLHVVGEP